VAELLAGDASTWFCWSQHQTPLRALEAVAPSPDAPAADGLRARLLPGLRSGRLLAAVAFAHVRRPGPPNPVATRVPGGWRLDGSLDWVTSWDIADVVMVMALGAGDDAGSLLASYLPAGRAPEPRQVVAGPPLRLLAMSAHRRSRSPGRRPRRRQALHERRLARQDAARTVVPGRPSG
jgi:alkylation response protein AidB-like acyl-CoA dehydrogenase